MAARIREEKRQPVSYKFPREVIESIERESQREGKSRTKYLIDCHDEHCKIKYTRIIPCSQCGADNNREKLITCWKCGKRF
jgi:hypothetical protein